MQKYVILRDLSGASDTEVHDYSQQADHILRGPVTRSGSGRRGPGSPSDIAREALRSGSASTPPDRLPEPKVETAELNAKEREDAARDPKVKGFAPLMPTILLAPVAMDDETETANTEADSWSIDAVGAQNSSLTGKGVSVCVLDTGIDMTHSAFAGVTLDKCDFTVGTPGGKTVELHPNWDVDGHGTHCAGTIFGRNVGSTRIGIARGVRKALIGKVLDDKGAGNTTMLFEGLQWAITRGVDVVSMSIGFDFPGLRDALVAKNWSPRQATSYALVTYGDNLRLFDRLMAIVRARAAFDEGTVIVAATGNESNRMLDIRIAASLPSAAEDVISVGAVGKGAAGARHGVANFSNTRPKLCAPGLGIVSAKTGGGLTSMNGTSMACPHVAGVAALWWEHLRAQSPDGRVPAAEVVAHLTASARREDVFDGDYSRDDYGSGLVSAPPAHG